MSDWQPISTAPTKPQCPRMLVTTGDEVWIAAHDEHGWYPDDADRYYPDPTHWMPLPAPARNDR